MNCAAEFLRLLARRCRFPELKETGAFNWWEELDTLDDGFYMVDSDYWLFDRIFNPMYDKSMFSRTSQL